MVTKSRQQRHIPQTATNSSANKLPLASIIVDDTRFEIRSDDQPELYAEYLKRKDIDIDFSSAKTQKDIANLRDKFAEKFKNFPSETKLKDAKEKYQSASNDFSYASHIHAIANMIIRDLGNTHNISDARYNGVLEYLKTIINAFANGKDIGEIMAIQEPNISIIPKIKHKDLLRLTKYAIGDAKASPTGQKIPKELILSLTEKLPTTRIRSMLLDPENNPDVCEYIEYFATLDNEACTKDTKSSSEFKTLLMQDKIRKDGLRTFDRLAEQHLKKLEKDKSLEERNKKIKAFNDATKELNKKRGLAKQKIVHVGNSGPVDPVARRIAKMRAKNLEH